VGITSSALSKAQASVSKAQADIDELEAGLSSATTKLKVLQSGDKAVDALTKPFADQAAVVRRRTDAAVSKAQAEVDEITAELEAARTRYAMATAALKTLRNVTD
jgi:chromosome segregation ATPase